MPATLTAPLTRRGARRAALVLALLTTGACRVDATVEVTLDRAGIGDVTVTVTADAEVVAAGPEIATDVRLADVRAAGWSVEGPTGLADGGLSLVLRHPVATPEEAVAVLAQLNGPDGPLRSIRITQRRSFASVTTDVSGAIRLDGGLAAFVDGGIVDLLGGAPYRQALAERNLTVDQALGLRLVVTVPGGIRTTDGSASPAVGSGTGASTTVTWQADLAAAAAQPVTASAVLRDTVAQSARRWRDFAPWAAAAWAALFLGVVLPIVSLFRRRRRAVR